MNAGESKMETEEVKNTKVDGSVQLMLIEGNQILSFVDGNVTLSDAATWSVDNADGPINAVEIKENIDGVEASAKVDKDEVVDNPFECISCDKAFEDKDSLVHHVETCHTGELIIYKCGHCDLAFEQVQSLKTHLVDAHVETIETETSTKDKNVNKTSESPAKPEEINFRQLSFQCQQCDKKFKVKRLFLKHIMKVHGESSEDANAVLNEMVKIHESDDPGDGVGEGTSGETVEFADVDFDGSIKIIDVNKNKVEGEDDGEQHVNVRVLKVKDVEKDDRQGFPCDHCDKTYKQRRSLRNHILDMHTGDRVVGCHLCAKVFSNNSILENHLKSHESKKSYGCEICGKKFVHHNYVKVHMQIHKGEKPYKCTICERAFHQKSQLNVHLITHTREKKYECKFCDKRFTLRLSLRRHVMAHTGERPFPCHVCPMKFRRISTLKRHWLTHPGADLNVSFVKTFPSVGEEKMNELLQSIQSEETTKVNDENMDENVPSKVKGQRKNKCKKFVKQFKCTKCDKAFSFKRNLIKHEQCHPASSVGNLYKCTSCEEQFETKALLRKHKSIHRTDKIYVCEVCNKNFYFLTHAKVHMRCHTGERPFECEVCKKRFTQSCHLTAHKIVHSDQVKFSCDLCEKKFKTKLRLRTHQRVHSGERPFVCEFCGKGFRRADTKKNHLVIHTGDKKFGCTICPKRFTTSWHLQVHLRSHNNGKNVPTRTKDNIVETDQNGGEQQVIDQQTVIQEIHLDLSNFENIVKSGIAVPENEIHIELSKEADEDGLENQGNVYLEAKVQNYQGDDVPVDVQIESGNVENIEADGEKNEIEIETSQVETNDDDDDSEKSG